MNDPIRIAQREHEVLQGLEAKAKLPPAVDSMSRQSGLTAYVG